MQVLYKKKFLKDLADLPLTYRSEIENFVFVVLPTTAKFSELMRFEKMKGYDFYYKARFGNYRVGVYYNNDILELRRVLHRREVYRYFP